MNKKEKEVEVDKKSVFDFDEKDFEELRDLNETFLILGCRVRTYANQIPEKLANYMSDKLFEQYKVAYMKMSAKKSIKDGTGLYVLKARKAALVPWRFLFFRNKIGKITDKELRKEFNKLFTEREQKLNDKEPSEN